MSSTVESKVEEEKGVADEIEGIEESESEFDEDDALLETLGGPQEATLAPQDAIPPEAPAEAPVSVPEPPKEVVPTVGATDATVIAPQPPAVAQTAEQGSIPTATQTIEAFKKWRDEAEDLLAKTHYALSDSDAEAIQADPKTLSKFAARVYLDAVTAATNILAHNLPAIMDNHTKLRADLQAAEGRFFEKWPGLREHVGTVTQFGRVYRQVNPQATEEQFVRDVGAQVAVALGIVPETARGQVVATPQQQVVGPTVLPHRPPAAVARPMGGPAAPISALEQMIMDDLME